MSSTSGNRPAAQTHAALPPRARRVLGRWPYVRNRLAWPLAAASVLSLVTTFVRPPLDAGAPAGWKLAEIAVLLAALVPVARWSPRRPAAISGALAAAAVALWTLPLLESPSWLERAGAALLWTLPVLAVAALGGYPRWAARRADRAVAAARRFQQLELARDLHDFVAHDVSAIVVQAQAARFVADRDPRQAVLALERIEKAGLSALASMDRTVRTLHAADGGPLGPSAPPGADQLPQLVRRFAAERSAAERAAECRYEAAPGALDALSREAGVAAYRLVVEALTNIRRHAPGTARVEVTVRRPGGRDGPVEVRVANDAPPGAGPPPSPLRRRGGSGLAGLRERVETSGGTLTAAPLDGGGWQVAARFPAAAS